MASPALLRNKALPFSLLNALTGVKRILCLLVSPYNCSNADYTATRAEVEKVRHPGILDARKFLKNQHLAESF